jgi:hypothetical protein
MSSATKAPGAEGPGDWVLVPREPTEEMVQAGWIDKEDVDPDDIYRAMIASAPAPSDPAGAGGDLGELERKIDAAAEAILSRRGFGYYTDPMEGGQDAYDISLEAREEATAALKAAGQLVASTPGQKGAGEDLVSYLHRQWAWSKETFGPALRTKGIVQHITKELREIEAEPHDLAEWVDVIILAMDGFWRHGGKPEDLLPAMQAKQDKNFARQWPDWRTMGEDQAIEHDRSSEGLTPAQTPPSPPSATPEGDPPMTVEGWQTINTAPRDGTLVAIKGTFLGGGEWESQGWFETSPADRRWYDAADDEPCRPTHWRPLAPSESPSTKEASDA